MLLIPATSLFGGKMLEEALSYIKSKTDPVPEIGIILGSGLGDFAENLENKIIIKYNEIPFFKTSSIEGHSGQLVFGKINNKNIVVMQGRIHYYEGYSIKDIVFPVKIMKKLEVKTLIVTNAAGGVNENFNVPDLMLIKDHINFMGTNPLIGMNDDEFGTRFPDMSEIYDKNLREKVKLCAKNLNFDLKEGVYLATTGPSYETPAEIKMFKTFGADAIGMSTVPEAIVANYCGIKVIGISCITNLAAGLNPSCLNHQEVIQESALIKNKFIKLLNEIINVL